MLPYWAARPHLYKPSIVFADDFTVSSTLADSALKANAGMLGRQFSISYQGTCTLNIPIDFIVISLSKNASKVV